MSMKRIASALTVAALAAPLLGAAPNLSAEVDTRAKAVEGKLIAWRRDIHEHPELGEHEVRTAKLVADHLRSLGIEVREGVGKTGVVGVLRGGRLGRVVALRADMDALPVTEDTGLPFASKATTTWQGRQTGVMHACGHDAHTAILMSVAEVLAGMKDKLPGTVVFIFQPAEEGISDADAAGRKTWGASQMVEEGALDNPKVEAVFGLHVVSGVPSGQLRWRPGPTMASSDSVRITVKGRQTHGAIPWGGVDPIVLASQVVLGLQTIESRQVDVSKEPSILTIGQIHGGSRENIIPDDVAMEGTIRAYDREMQKDIQARVKRTAELIAQSGGGQALVNIIEKYPPTVNNPDLTAQMAPTLKRTAGEGHWNDNPPKVTASEDFSFFQQKVPGVFVHLGVTPPDKLATAAANHSPQFYVDEAALPLGVRALANLAVDYLQAPAARR
jgi:amidohydrolase